MLGASTRAHHVPAVIQPRQIFADTGRTGLIATALLDLRQA